ncbi:hypothetical protein DFA_05252 [Cavenderia fasciculata]|uniref:Zinc-ribbon 15 domain-containing protein n=1 Tax=Cavenderia fasciculata TaxID=261658 RepID=F4PNR9_CACFS|nr:uncharacterized protein DFA_05252 [Cavenderia fasciculata]EGG23122.1 hypothetical protein DFA_05252 [Cavenderia fasciculata]|eukprot:XP_004360973.1 hypothetical protein DFA_05252 [Cavenderia fasciculata]
MWIPIIIPFGTTGKSKIVDNIIRVCPNCHNRSVQLERNDSWAHLFFIPFCKVKKGSPFLHCAACGCTVPYVEGYENEALKDFGYSNNSEAFASMQQQQQPPPPPPGPNQQYYNGNYSNPNQSYMEEDGHPQQQQQQYNNYNDQSTFYESNNMPTNQVQSETPIQKKKHKFFHRN